MVSTEIDVEYKNSDEQALYVNGAQGGFTPQGELLVRLYFEQLKMNDNSVLSVDETGKILKENPNDERKVIREIKTRIILNQTFLISFHAWLGKKIEELDLIKITNEDKDE